MSQGYDNFIISASPRAQLPNNFLKRNYKTKPLNDHGVSIQTHLNMLILKYSMQEGMFISIYLSGLKYNIKNSTNSVRKLKRVENVSAVRFLILFEVKFLKIMDKKRNH